MTSGHYRDVAPTALGGVPVLRVRNFRVNKPIPKPFFVANIERR